MNPAVGAQQGPIYIEKVGIAIIPTKSRLNRDLGRCFFLGADGISRVNSGLRAHRRFVQNGGTLAARRPLQAVANLFGIELQFCDRAAKRVAVHAELTSCFALVSPVMRQNLKNEAPLKLTHCLVVMNAAGVHLRHKTIQLTFHENLFSFLPARPPGLSYLEN